MVRMAVTEATTLKEGNYQGHIEREEPYTATFKDKDGNTGQARYLRLYIRVEGEVKRDGEPIYLRPTFPADTVSSKSQLGKVLKNFGVDLDPDKLKELDTEEVLVGQNVTFMTVNDEDGWAEVIPESLRPIGDN